MSKKIEKSAAESTDARTGWRSEEGSVLAVLYRPQQWAKSRDTHTKKFPPTAKHASYKPADTFLQLRRLVFLTLVLVLTEKDRIHRNNMIK